MKYSVVYTPFAEYQLGDIWLRATSRSDVTEAANRIDAELRQNPDTVGRERSDGRRVLVVPPLTAVFEVQAADRLAKVVSIRYSP